MIGVVRVEGRDVDRREEGAGGVSGGMGGPLVGVEGVVPWREVEVVAWAVVGL